MKKLKIFYCEIFISAFLASPTIWAQVTPNDVATPYANRQPPYSEQDLVKIFVNIARKADDYGYVSKSEIESEFKFKIPAARSDRKNAFNFPAATYSATAYVDWYFDLLYIDYEKKKSDFSFGWGTPPGETPLPFSAAPQKYCIKFNAISESFKEAGWSVFAKNSNPIFTFIQYKKDATNGELQLTFNTASSCMVSFLISSHTDH